eukprot:15419154-Alexandrium_andersonii.AAC.1
MIPRGLRQPEAQNLPPEIEELGHRPPPVPYLGALGAPGGDGADNAFAECIRPRLSPHAALRPPSAPSMMPCGWS